MRVTTQLPALLALAALVGCGSEGARPRVPAAPAAPQFERAANRLCADAGAKITALPPLAKANFLGQVRYEQELIRGLVAHLKPLRPPAAKRRGFDRFLRDTAEQASIIDGAISALRNRRARMARALLKRLSAKGETADRAAASIGLADCARDYSPVPHPTA